jgi:DNA-directed RNA polymerase subunit beta
MNKKKKSAFPLQKKLAKILLTFYFTIMSGKNKEIKFSRKMKFAPFFSSHNSQSSMNSISFSKLTCSVHKMQRQNPNGFSLFFSKKEKTEKSTKYILQKYQRSNQDTLIFQRPLVREGEWIQSGDILADCSTSLGGELSLGKNIFIAYMPWEGYNYEDAILISQRLVTEDVYTSIHIESYEVETKSTKLGKEQITKKIPEVPESQLCHLDERGIVKRGTSVKEGDILVGKVTPVQKKFISAYEKLLYTILEKELIPMRDSSLRTPKGLKAKVLEVKILNFSNSQNFLNQTFRKKTQKDQNIFQNPFFTEKNQILFKQISIRNKKENPCTSAFSASIHFDESNHLDKVICVHPSIRPSVHPQSGEAEKWRSGEVEKRSTGLDKVPAGVKAGAKAGVGFSAKQMSTSPQRGRVLSTMSSAFASASATPLFRRDKVQADGWVQLQMTSSSAKRVLSTTLTQKSGSRHMHPLALRPGGCKEGGWASPATKFWRMQTKFQNSMKSVYTVGKNFSFFVPSFSTNTKILKRKQNLFSFVVQNQQKTKNVQHSFQQTLNKFQSSSLFPLQSETPEKVQVYLVEKRKIQVGDKMSGRHGNKGIVSQILPIPDMPFLPDGTPLDMVLNPLGVPSRMNVGQIYECILGLASKYLQQYYRIQPFDEIYGPQASRSFTFSKLYEARQKTSQKWLFNPCYPGKIQIFDGRTGEPYENPVTVGISYILKLVHLVDDKIHARSTGPYSLVTQQPLKGRSKYGGQRLGEMEVWAIEAYGAAFVLLEMLTIKSDDISGRMTLWSNILLNMPIYIGTPESFKVLVCELQALCLDMGLYKLNKKGFLTQIEHLMQLP